MIRFKPYNYPLDGESEDQRIRRIIASQSRHREHKRLLKISQGADRRKLAEALVDLDRLCRSTAKVPTVLVEWDRVALLAGRVEREARKLEAAQRLRRMERQLVKDGLAIKLRKGES